MTTHYLYFNFAICYGMYFIMLWLTKQNGSLQLFGDKKGVIKNKGGLIGLHIAGLLWLGLVPLVWTTPALQIFSGNGIFTYGTMSAYLLILMLMIMIGLREGKQMIGQNEKETDISWSFYLRYLTVRIPFLISYELFFRGLLLFANYNIAGLVPSLLADSILTAFIHFFNGKKIIIGCIPFSIICCVFNLQAQSVWPSIILHMALSFSHEWYFVNKFFHPLKINI